VRNASDLSLYTGELQAASTLRITDHDNGAGDFTPATVEDQALSFTVPCSSGTCALDTTVEAIMPGVVKETKRAIWDLGQVRVFDGGPDGVVDTRPNSRFADQGIFVP
jgi:hypothetical protein